MACTVGFGQPKSLRCQLACKRLAGLLAQHCSNLKLPTHPSITEPLMSISSQFVVYSVVLCSKTVALYSIRSQLIREIVSLPGPQNLIFPVMAIPTGWHTLA